MRSDHNMKTLDINHFTKYGLMFEEYANVLDPKNGSFLVTSSKNNIERIHSTLASAKDDLINDPLAQTIWHIRTDGSRKVIYKRPS